MHLTPNESDGLPSALKGYTAAASNTNGNIVESGRIGRILPHVAITGAMRCWIMEGAMTFGS